ncbi:MAG: polymer-forming cytoskeletal protein, partial [Clostridiaceae bacterium]|nr:polymer-forming cytoskeletal protein [Clostridiaceae bacterium]
KVKGNILCEETVRLSGEIEGNVTSMSIEVKGATIKGDLRMKYTAIFEEGSRLSGNLEAESAVINGSVEGDMRIHGNLRIMSHSRINGDIFAGSLEIDKGAVVNGKVSVVAEDDKSQMPENKTAAAKETNSNSTAEAAKPAPKIAPTPANNSINPIKP